MGSMANIGTEASAASNECDACCLEHRTRQDVQQNVVSESRPFSHAAGVRIVNPLPIIKIRIYEVGAMATISLRISPRQQEKTVLHPHHQLDHESLTHFSQARLPALQSHLN